MKPIDYLRALARREPKLATGGIGTADQTVPLQSDGCAWPSPPADATPSSFIELSGTVTEADVEAVRAALTISARPRRDEVTCPCAVIYTRCHYPDKHQRLPR